LLGSQSAEEECHEVWGCSRSNTARYRCDRGDRVRGRPAEIGNRYTVDTLTVTSTRQADGNAVQEGIITGHLTGTISGTYVAQFDWVVHPSGQLEAHVTGLVTGTSPCGSGAMPFRTDTSGTFAAYAGTHEGIENANNTANTATNFELVGCGLNLTYTGTYRCLS
jgi:hypothetical protein